MTFQRSAFQNVGFQVGPAPIIPRPPNLPAGGGAPYGPAFPRKSIRELYRQLPQSVAQPDVQAEPEHSAETPTAQILGPSQLPIMMNLGTGPVMVGMMPSLKAFEQQIKDDDDAIVAILLSI